MSTSGASLRILGRYSAAGSELCGSRLALLKFARGVEAAGLKQVWRLHIPDEKPSPYDGFRRSLEIGSDDSRSLVDIARESDHLCITGPAAHLQTLLREIEALADRVRLDRTGRESTHIHLEHYDGHPWLERNCEPLIIEVEKD